MSVRTRFETRLLPALSGLILLGFVGAVGAVAIGGPHATSSTLDGGPLATYRPPTWGSLKDGTWMAQTEKWLDQHVPGRQHWLQWHAQIVRQALDQQVIKDVYIGEPHGFLLQNVGVLRAKPQLAVDARTLGQQVRAAGSPLLSVYVPRREEVFADLLPSAWPRNLTASRPQLLSALAQAGPLLDLTSTLSDPARRFGYYYRSDHHWTPAGALAALDAITAKAATMGVDIPADTRPFRVHRYGTYYGSLGRIVTAGGTPQPDTFDVPLPATLRAHACLDSTCSGPTFDRSLAAGGSTYANRYRAFLGGDAGYQEIENPSPLAHGRILLIKDSFGDALATYLAERVSTLVTIDERHYTGPDIRDVVRRLHPDLVILMHNQVSVMGSTSFNPGIWVDAAAAERRRDATPGGPEDS